MTPINILSSCQNCRKRNLNMKWVTCTGYMTGASAWALSNLAEPEYLGFESMLNGLRCGERGLSFSSPKMGGIFSKAMKVP